MDAKSRTLRSHGALNLCPHKVTDATFLGHPFFDPRDLVLVKYEMLRRVRIEGLSVTRAVASFGFSRPVYYSTLASFERQGLFGLIPRRRGPRHAHKLSDAVVVFLRLQRTKDKTVRAADLAALVRERFGLTLHPRSIERALSAGGKRGRLRLARLPRPIKLTGAWIGPNAMKTCAGRLGKSRRTLRGVRDSPSSCVKDSSPGSVPGRPKLPRGRRMPNSRR
jgi:transposase